MRENHFVAKSKSLGFFSSTFAALKLAFAPVSPGAVHGAKSSARSPSPKFLAAVAVAAVSTQMATAQIPQAEAVRMEILYSMRQNWSAYWPNIPVDSGYVYTSKSGSQYLSNWNYLASDVNIVMDVVARAGQYFTVGNRITSANGLYSYGLQKPATWPTALGRGGQCPWYATTIYQRAGIARLTWNYSKYSTKATQFGWWAANGRRGDIIFKSGVHVAVIFEVHAGGFWLAESNYVNPYDRNWFVRGATAGPASEVISMRWVAAKDLAGWQRIPVDQTWRL